MKQNQNTKKVKSLKSNKLAAKKSNGGRGTSILPAFQPLSDWVSKRDVHANLDFFDDISDIRSCTKLYPHNILKLNHPGGDGLDHWQMMISYFYEETKSMKVAFYKVYNLHYQYFGFHRFNNYNSFKTRFKTYIKNMK